MASYKFLRRMNELVVNTVLPRDAKKSEEELKNERARDSAMLGRVTRTSGLTLSENTTHVLTSEQIADMMYQAYYAGHMIGEFGITLTDEEMEELSFIND